MKNKLLDTLHNSVPANYYQNGIKTNIFQRYWHNRRFQEVKKIIEKDKPLNLLDIGCHSGKFTYEISKKLVHTKITGIDISNDAIKYAIKTYKNISFVVSDAQDISFKNSSFDYVTCLEVMEHVMSPKKVITEIKRVLKKSGMVIILVPSENILFKLIWYFWIRLGPGKVWNHTHISEFSGTKLDQLLIKNGFKIIRKKHFNLGMLLMIKAIKIT
jgi:ubiquinone/menaquinone biosynthesis C-methylase UbiE